MRLRPYLTLLRHNPAFARLFVAQLISFGGDWFATVAILGLALEVTGSAGVAALLLVMQEGAFAFASPFAGVLADRLDRRRLLVAADLLRVPVALSLLLVHDSGTLWIAALATAVLSVGAAAFEPTSSASLPNLVDDEDLPAANVLLGASWGTMLAVGAALGGVVVVLAGREAAFVINAASFGLSALLIVGIRRPFREAAPAIGHHANRGGLGGSLGAIGHVVGYAREHRTLAVLLLSKTTFGVGGGVIVMLAVFGDSVLGGGEAGIGILFAARGLGALIGPFLARSVVDLSDRGLVLGIGASFGVFAVSYGLLPLMPILPLAALCAFTAHLGGGAQWTLSTYGLQRSAPDAIRGRVFSLDYGLVGVSMAVSTLLVGYLADQVSPSVAVWAMVALAGTAAVVWLAFARPIWRRPASGEG